MKLPWARQFVTPPRASRFADELSGKYILYEAGDICVTLSVTRIQSSAYVGNAVYLFKYEFVTFYTKI